MYSVPLSWSCRKNIPIREQLLQMYRAVEGHQRSVFARAIEQSEERSAGNRVGAGGAGERDWERESQERESGDFDREVQSQVSVLSASFKNIGF